MDRFVCIYVGQFNGSTILCCCMVVMLQIFFFSKLKIYICCSLFPFSMVFLFMEWNATTAKLQQRQHQQQTHSNHTINIISLNQKQTFNFLSLFLYFMCIVVVFCRCVVVLLYINAGLCLILDILVKYAYTLEFYSLCVSVFKNILFFALSTWCCCFIIPFYVYLWSWARRESPSKSHPLDWKNIPSICCHFNYL